jgi:hypothetical protein
MDWFWERPSNSMHVGQTKPEEKRAQHWASLCLFFYRQLGIYTVIAKMRTSIWAREEDLAPNMWGVLKN